MFVHRFCSMIVLLGLLYLTLFRNLTGAVAYTVLGLFFTVFLTKEICEMLENIQIKSHKGFLYIINAVIFLLAEGYFISGFPLPPKNRSINDLLLLCSSGAGFMFAGVILLLFLLVLFMILLSVNSEEKLKKILTDIAVFILVNIPVSLMNVIFFVSDSIMSHQISYGTLNGLFLYYILGTKSGDIGAYVIGCLSNKILKGGNHKMIPAISPGKSYEGMIGGLLTSIGVSYLILVQCKITSFLPKIVLGGVLLYFSGMIGDLVESSLKRTCKVKDSGKIIPGIGGVYDLLDSLIFSAPVFLFYVFLLMATRAEI